VNAPAALCAAFVLAVGSCADAAEPQDEPAPAEEAPAEEVAPESTPEEVDPVPAPDTTDAVEITTRDQRNDLLGKVVFITGTVRREKPGDSIARDGFDLMCPDFRFADELVRTTVTAVGTLDRLETPAATVGPDGAISQGPSTSTVRFILRDCALK